MEAEVLDIKALLLTALLVTTSLAWFPAGQGHPGTDLPNDIDIHERFPGDTFGIALRSDEAFKVLNNSHFIVTGFFDSGFNATGEPRQDAGAMIGVVRYFDGSCNGCMVSMVGRSIKDESDARVATDGPVTYSFETDPNSAGWASLGVGVTYPTNTAFQGPRGDASQVTYRFFVTVPGASEVHVNLHLHVNKPVDILSQTSHAGGFLVTGEDFAPANHVDTMAASAMTDGEAVLSLDPSGGDRVYAYMSPSWLGTSVVAPFGSGAALRTNTVGAGFYGVEVPSGNTFAGGGVAAGAPSGPFLLGMTQTGDYRFFVDAEANAGPGDMYVVGFQGPVS